MVWQKGHIAAIEYDQTKCNTAKPYDNKAWLQLYSLNKDTVSG